MKRIVFITGPDAEYGFSLAGMPQRTAAYSEGTEGLLREAMTEENGLVIIDERLMKDVTEERLREIEKRWHGILLILPAPERPGVVAEDYIARLMQRAIGYHVRLQL